MGSEGNSSSIESIDRREDEGIGIGCQLGMGRTKRGCVPDAFGWVNAEPLVLGGDLRGLPPTDALP